MSFEQEYSTRSHRALVGGFSQYVANKVCRWFALLALRFEIQQERRDLAQLPDHLLKDIGVDRVDAERESARDFFDIPKSRLGVFLLFL